MKLSVFAITLLMLLSASNGFVSTTARPCRGRRAPIHEVSSLFLAKGFGAQNDNKKTKKKAKPQIINKQNQIFDRTYGRDEQDDTVALESMGDFFEKHVDWKPLFRSLSASSSVPAMTHLDAAAADEDDFEFHVESTPWKELEAIPSDEDDKKVIASFLDSMQQALIDMPNTHDESPLADADLPFVEEGRRMLACTRFQVVRNHQYESLFETCWNELTTLSRNDVVDTGSLIILPELLNESDDWDNFLQSFCSSRVQQPLEWLGVDDCFEIATIQRSSTPAVRLLHKLSDIPDLSARPPADGA